MWVVTMSIILLILLILIVGTFCLLISRNDSGSHEFANKELSYVKDKKKYENMKTKYIQKNDLSFNYPEYYDIGNYPSSDGIHKSIVALSKNDRKCEIYVMEYEYAHFDPNARLNSNFLKKYLKMQGYTNVKDNKSLPYFFNARINSEKGKINSKIAFCFNYPDVIMIVGNTLHNTNYDCTEDIIMIYDTIRNKQYSYD